MILENLTNAELIRHTDNSPTASELAHELANRLDRAMRELKRREEQPTHHDGELYDPRPAD
jgi:hypothetical protein